MYRDNTARKIEDIQYQLALGKTRPEVAKALGFTDVTGLYHFASRHKLVWSAEKKNYDATGNDGNPIEAVKTPNNVPTGKVANIISMFERGMNGREIAKKLRFSNHQEMADYMMSKGYAWNESKQNYVIQPQEITETIEDPNQVIEAITRTVIKTDMRVIEQYADLLMLLNSNRDKLETLLMANANGETVNVDAITVPRYVLAGVTINKGIKINVGLDKIVKEFSLERNVSQKDIIEVALIDFLKKHGYSDDVKVALRV